MTAPPQKEKDSRPGSVTASPGVGTYCDSVTSTGRFSGKAPAYRNSSLAKRLLDSAPEPEPGSGPRKTLRWKNNRKSAGFILPEMFQGLELWSWRALFVAAVIIHFIHGGAR